MGIAICDLLYELGMLVEPLVMRMIHLALQSSVIHTDDTKIKMLDIGICREAKFWPYQGDWLQQYVVFDFTLDRTRIGPKNFLANYPRYLQVATCNGLPSLHVTHFGLDLGVLGAGKGRWALVERPFFTGTWFKVFLDPNLLRFDTPERRLSLGWQPKITIW